MNDVLPACWLRRVHPRAGGGSRTKGKKMRNELNANQDSRNGYNTLPVSSFVTFFTPYFTMVRISLASVGSKILSFSYRLIADTICLLRLLAASPSKYLSPIVTPTLSPTPAMTRSCPFIATVTYSATPRPISVSFEILTPAKDAVSVKPSDLFECLNGADYCFDIKPLKFGLQNS